MDRALAQGWHRDPGSPDIPGSRGRRLDWTRYSGAEDNVCPVPLSGSFPRIQISKHEGRIPSTLVFHNDQLVPPELCRLRYQTIPHEYHAPVLFFNHPHPHHAPSVYGFCYNDGSRIEICLNPIFNGVIQRSVGSRAFGLWYQLLSTCYHEFGHMATAAQCRDVSGHRYWADLRAFWYVEDLAIQWSNRKLCELRDHDPRLAQPANLSGYLGARLCKWLRTLQTLDTEEVRVLRINEWRCRKTGGQITPGQVLQALNTCPFHYPNVYRVLRSVSEGIGIDYVDGAGRHHKLYSWGDLPVLGTRMVQSGRLIARPLEPRYPPSWELLRWTGSRPEDFFENETNEEHESETT